MNTPIDPSVCPLCGEPNQCAMEIAKSTGQPQEPYWCVSVVFNPETLNKVPTQAQNQACICKRCASGSDAQ